MELQKLFAQGLVWTTESSSFLRRENRFVATFGIPEIDNALPFGGLAFSCIHECSLEDVSLSSQHNWHAPLFVVSSLLGSTISSLADKAVLPPEKKLIAWIGRKCWPTAHLLQTTLADISKDNTSWVNNCLFINPPNKAKRLWTIIQMLRTNSTLAVIAEGSGFDMKATRQLQLAAKKGMSLGIILRPPWELTTPSAATTKWKFSPAPSKDEELSWSVELLRAKGVISLPDNVSNVNQTFSTPRTIYWPRKWLIEWNKEDGKNSLRIVTDGRKDDEVSARRMA